MTRPLSSVRPVCPCAAPRLDSARTQRRGSWRKSRGDMRTHGLSRMRTPADTVRTDGAWTRDDAEEEGGPPAEGGSRGRIPRPAALGGKRAAGRAGGAPRAARASGVSAGTVTHAMTAPTNPMSAAGGRPGDEASSIDTEWLSIWRLSLLLSTRRRRCGRGSPISPLPSSFFSLAEASAKGERWRAYPRRIRGDWRAVVLGQPGHLAVPRAHPHAAADERAVAREGGVGHRDALRGGGGARGELEKGEGGGVRGGGVRWGPWGRWGRQGWWGRRGGGWGEVGG